MFFGGMTVFLVLPPVPWLMSLDNCRPAIPMIRQIRCLGPVFVIFGFWQLGWIAVREGIRMGKDIESRIACMNWEEVARAEGLEYIWGF